MSLRFPAGLALDSTVKLAIPCRGPNNSTFFEENSANHRAITVHGSVKNSNGKTLYGQNMGYFDGGSYLTIPASSDWSFGGPSSITPFSISIWISPSSAVFSSANTAIPIIACVASSTVVWVLRFGNTSASDLDFLVYNNGSVARMQAAHGMTAGGLYNLKVVRGLSNSTSNWAIYVNSSQIATLSSSAAFPDFSTAALQIGADINNNNLYFTGYMGDCVIKSGNYGAVGNPATVATRRII